MGKHASCPDREVRYHLLQPHSNFAIDKDTSRNIGLVWRYIRMSAYGASRKVEADFRTATPGDSRDCSPVAFAV